jgi:hypothetical protein
MPDTTLESQLDAQPGTALTNSRLQLRGVGNVRSAYPPTWRGKLIDEHRTGGVCQGVDPVSPSYVGVQVSCMPHIPEVVG